MLEPDAVRGLVALLLSCGNLTNYRSPTVERAQVAMTAGLKEAPYLEDKVAEFKLHLPTEARIIPYKPHGDRFKDAPQVLRFRCTSSKLVTIYHLLYPGRKRYITSNVLELCGGKAGGWLIAEHGKRGKYGLELWSTADSFEEVVRIAQWLQMITGAECEIRITGSRKHPVIHLSPDSAAKACEVLVPYAPPSRKQLFLLCMNDVNPVFDPDHLLLPGQGKAFFEGRKVKAVARTAKT